MLHPHFTLIHFCIFYLLPFCIFVSFYLSEICLDDLLSCSNPLILSLISSLLLFSYIDLLNLNYYIFNICDCHYIFLYSELIIFYFVLCYGLLFFIFFRILNINFQVTIRLLYYLEFLWHEFFQLLRWLPSFLGLLFLRHFGILFSE